jgi:hypothetical protein
VSPLRRIRAHRSDPPNEEIPLKSRMMKLVCRLLVATLALLPLQSPLAGMISAGEAAAPVGVQGERAALLELVERPGLAGQLQALGIDPAAARDRVAAMTDAEVRAVSKRLDTLPAGATKNNMWGYVGLLTIAFILWYTWK